MKPPRTSKHNSTGVDSSPNFSQKRDAPSDKPKEGSVSKPKRLNPHRGLSLWAVFLWLIKLVTSVKYVYMLLYIHGSRLLVLEEHAT